MGFWWTFFSGHMNVGRRVTIFGSNAMFWCVCIYGTKWGHLHIDLPIWTRLTGKIGWCIYFSPNGTPWACTWYVGTRDKHEHIRSEIRKRHFGHNFKMISGSYAESNLYKLNEEMDSILWLQRKAI